MDKVYDKPYPPVLQKGKQMSRYIDADALEYDTEWSEYHDGFTAYSQMAIDTAPTIDIVRCKECKWADWYKTADGEQFCYCIETGNGGRTADDFCSYGERKNDE